MTVAGAHVVGVVTNAVPEAPDGAPSSVRSMPVTARVAPTALAGMPVIVASSP